MSQVGYSIDGSSPLSPRKTGRSNFPVQNSTSIWISVLSACLTLVEQNYRLIVFSLPFYLPVAYGIRDGMGENGNEFSNNLFSDLAPLLTLFGEQVTKQFISQSMGWADSILLAAAPLGILTVIVSAIRVGGEQWLKNVIGRARESDGVAEAELMSSTSSDVCELWSKRGVVRVLGSPDISQLIYRADSQGKFIHDRNGGIYGLDEAANAKIISKSSSRSEPATATNHRESSNLVLNICGSGVGRVELWLYATFGIVLQLSVWVWCIFVVKFLKWQKSGKAIVPYALPFTIAGSALVCFGTAICSHVVEASLLNTFTKSLASPVIVIADNRPKPSRISNPRV